MSGLAIGGARIGPNAVTRLIEALTALEGVAALTRIFAEAGVVAYLANAPRAMVPDEDVARLHKALHDVVGPARAAAIGAEAGRRTGAYLLANRIPRLAQGALRLVPRRAAMRLLLRAIGRHAWTFAGAGVFAWRETGRIFKLTIAGGPVSRHVEADAPACAYYAATFETIFRAIIDPRCAVVETECEACGAPACMFEVRFG
jgi:divinyl protochlorophyllide a 8-vinyl-reductase